MRALFRFSWTTIRLLLAAMALVLFVVLILSRTEVGRDGVRRGLEAAFARELAGTLEIGTLTGNLIGTLYARDIIVRGEDGIPLLRADSLVLYPSVRDLLRRRLRIDEAVVYRPHLWVTEDSTGWNWMHLLEPALRKERAGTWDVQSLALQIVDGTVDLQRNGPRSMLATSGYLTDYRQLQIEAFNTSLQVSPNRDGDLVFSLTDVALHLNEPQTQVTFDGQIAHIVRPNPVTTVDGALAVNSSTLDGSLVWSETDRPFEIEGRLYPRELRALFPILPDAPEIRLQLEGALSKRAVRVANAGIAHGRSRLSARGAVAWREGSVTVSGVRLDGSLTRRDVVALMPDAPEQIYRMADNATVRIEGSSGFEDGLTAFQWTARYASPMGTLQSQGRAERRDAWRVVFSAAPRAFTPEALVPRATNTHLTGTIDGILQQRGSAWTSSGVSINLLQSQVLGRAVDTLAAQVAWDETSLTVEGTAQQGPGRWRTSATLARDLTVLAAQIDARQATLSSLLPGTPVEARFSGSLTVDARRLDSGMPRGIVRIDGTRATLTRDTLEVQVDSLNAVVRLSEAGEAFARVSSSALLLELDGKLDAAQPLQSIASWGRLAAQEARRLLPPPRHAPRPDSLSSPPRPVQTPFDLSGRIVLRDPRLLSLAGLRLASTVDATFSTVADARALHFEVQSASAPRHSDTALGSVSRLTMTATLRASGGLDAAVDAAFDTVKLGRVALSATQLTASLANRRAVVIARSGAYGNESLRAAIRAELGAEETRLTVDTLRIAAGPYTLSTPHAQTLYAYADGLVLPGFALEGNATQTRIDLRGALSPAASDTLFARVRSLPLSPITARLNPKFRFGGDVEADIALTGAFAQPEVTGTVEAPALTWGDDLVGDVRVTSFYAPSTPDVALDVTVGPSRVPPSGFRTPSNVLQLGGTFRLPRRQRGATDAGTLNLRLASAQADAFFFDHLFPDLLDGASGRITGDGFIGGSFRKPLFEGQFEIADARFAIPKFQLAYRAEAQVAVDQQGIHVLRATVTDAQNGLAAINGSILFNDYRFFSLDFTGELSRLLILNVAESPDLAFYGTMRASGSTQLSGPLSAARLRSGDALLTSDSEIFIPIRGAAEVSDPGFIVFADSTGSLPDLAQVARRTSVIGQVEGERKFVDGLDMDLSLRAPDGVAVNLVTDPLAGDVMRAVGAGRVQLVRRDGDFQLFGTLDVSGGEYLFTAGEVFIRRFDIREGEIVWDGDPLDPRLDVQAQYATRVSLAGTPYDRRGTRFLPVVVGLSVQDRLSALRLGLRLDFDRSNRGQVLADVQEMEQFLNQPDRQAEFATSVLLTNSFLLTTSPTDPGATETLASTGNRFAFASLSQLVATQLNRYLGAVLPGVDLNLGLQGERADNLDLTYGIALRLLDERLVIRGSGLYQSDQNESAQGLQGEFVVEVRLSPSVSVEVFYRREEDVLQSIVTSSTGAGLSYNTQFTSWNAFWRRIIGDDAQTATTNSP